MSNKLYAKLVIGITLVICIVLGSMTAIIDPLFHFHAPLEILSYDFLDERYMNDGISRHFDYDAIIIGTSLTESIKPSSVDEIFETHSIKIPYSGGRYKEINNALCRALEYNPSTKIVFRCLDSNLLLNDPDYERYSNTPKYLYDDDIFNDINYILNKDIFLNYTLHTLEYTHSGNTTTSFDEYANWDSKAEYGTDALKNNLYLNQKASIESVELTKEDYEKISRNVNQNIIPAVKNNPNTIFYMYFSPYHISYWNERIYDGTFHYFIEAEKIAVTELLNYDNVKVFSFLEDQDFLCNDNYYKDPLHYSSAANKILYEYMADGMFQITTENFEEHYSKIYTLYK